MNRPCGSNQKPFNGISIPHPALFGNPELGPRTERNVRSSRPQRFSGSLRFTQCFGATPAVHGSTDSIAKSAMNTGAS